jgi:hypothetical protein
MVCPLHLAGGRFNKERNSSIACFIEDRSEGECSKETAERANLIFTDDKEGQSPEFEIPMTCQWQDRSLSPSGTSSGRNGTYHTGRPLQ